MEAFLLSFGCAGLIGGFTYSYFFLQGKAESYGEMQRLILEDRRWKPEFDKLYETLVTAANKMADLTRVREETNPRSLSSARQVKARVDQREKSLSAIDRGLERSTQALNVRETTIRLLSNDVIRVLSLLDNPLVRDGLRLRHNSPADCSTQGVEHLRLDALLFRENLRTVRGEFEAWHAIIAERRTDAVASADIAQIIAHDVDHARQSLDEMPDIPDAESVAVAPSEPTPERVHVPVSEFTRTDVHPAAAIAHWIDANYLQHKESADSSPGDSEEDSTFPVLLTRWVRSNLVEFIDQIHAHRARIKDLNDQHFASADGRERSLLNEALRVYTRTEAMMDGLADEQTAAFVRFEPQVGDMFESGEHDIIGEEPSELDVDCIVRVRLPGYRWRGLVVRPAAVVVSSG